MKLEKWHLSITLVCLLFGTLFTSNLKSHLQENPLAARNKTLVNVIKTQEEKNRELEREIAATREKIEAYQTRQSDAGFQALKQELESLRSLAGQTAVEGPGLVITLNDQDKARTVRDEEAEFYIIHYYDILYIVNDLRAAGAEAISVNGERVVSTTDIRCAGNIITVNLHRLAPVYEIRAIGNPVQLESVVRSGQYTTLEQAKFPVTLERQDRITIPAYTGSYTFNYASVPKEGV